MKNLQLNQSTGRLMTYAGLIIVALPLYLYLLWIYSTIATNDLSAAAGLFDSLLPFYLKGFRIAFIVSLVLSAAGLIIGITGTTKHVSCYRSNTFLVVISGLLLFLDMVRLL